MATYIALIDYTDQGMRNIKDSPKRAAAFSACAATCPPKTRDGRLGLLPINR